MRLLLAFVILAAFCLTSPISSAREANNAAEVWGLLGTWATDCSTSPSRQNAYLGYKRGADRRLIHFRDFGDARDETPVLATEILGDGTLAITASFRTEAGDQTRRWIIKRVTADSYQALENRRVDNGQYTIKDGVLVHNGKAPPVVSRCK